MGTNFRIDKLDRLSDPTKYKVPCGMHTIIRLSDKPATFAELAEISHILARGKVAVVSYWDEKKQDYIITKVIESNYK